MLKRNKVILNKMILTVTFGTIFSVSTQTVFAESLDKCAKCKPKNTLQLVDHKLAENKPQQPQHKNASNEQKHSHKESNENATNNGSSRDGSSRENSAQSGIEKGNDRENDMGSGD